MQLVEQAISAKWAQDEVTESKSVVLRFFDWCKSQEDNRLLWLAVIVFMHGCVLTPLTLITIFAGGNSMISWAFAIGAMAMALISNLAAMPTRYTLPIFALSVLIDVTVMVVSLYNFY
jgi:hypothetical protein